MQNLDKKITRNEPDNVFARSGLIINNVKDQFAN